MIATIILVGYVILLIAMAHGRAIPIIAVSISNVLLAELLIITTPTIPTVIMSLMFLIVNALVLKDAIEAESIKYK